jgi:amino acid transporter
MDGTSAASADSDSSHQNAAEDGKGSQLGGFLCWAVVFADIGTSVYYTPGILFGQVGVHAAIFVVLTLFVFVLLTLKYAEVAVRYREGGGVVTVATQAIHPFAGLLGGMFILVDYFLTAAISGISGLIYLSVVAPGLKPVVLPATVIALVALALLNLIGVSASAKVTAVVASIAAASQLAVVAAVVIKIGPQHIPATVPKAFAGPHFTPLTVLTGYAGAFLAFSGLESIAQLAPTMRQPRRRVSRLAMGAVVCTVALTSPLLTLWSTTLLPAGKSDPNQFVSLLGGFSIGQLLQSEVAITGAVLLVFASNTAIIGSYHVFLALTRMQFLPRFLEQRNRWRNTPHWAVLASMGIPLLVLLAVRGDVGVLGDLYAFGLLGAFTMTCVSLDIIRWHERHPVPTSETYDLHDAALHGTTHRSKTKPVHAVSRLNFIVGVVTTMLVSVAWLTNLFAKPMATLFGGLVTLAGLSIAFITYTLGQRRGHPAVFPLLHYSGQSPFFLSRARRMPTVSVLALLSQDSDETEALVQAAASAAHGQPVVFMHQGQARAHAHLPQIFEVVDPYLDDQGAQKSFAAAEHMARERKINRRYVYVPSNHETDAIAELWTALQPRDVLVAAVDEHYLEGIPPDKLERINASSHTVLHYRTI